ncbi:phage tail length tape measure family protein [Cohaesibacter gelatinilyticus]|uniref:Prophage tail length tape measure protein n=1 Tax=Cohaesibacter gelatinilyticus TaxID=372072 RepID=A0A285PJY8_9HYPH|nr:phage tail length tape measure family protein [Cohaesibacter gelatinilyticus]SNZ21728.1 Prophage tail length tape measure protein [Cohaesibacter gelatinilyticus]
MAVKEEVLITKLELRVRDAERNAKRFEKKFTESMGRATANSKKFNTSIANGSSRIQAATKSHRRLGHAVQNASYQFGDFFVQIASGQDAIRAMSQQVPQLLGGFGMMGAVLGGVAAGAGALWQVMSSSDSASSSLAHVNSLLDEMAKKYDDVAIAMKATQEAAKFDQVITDTDRTEVSVRKLEKALDDAMQNIARNMEAWSRNIGDVDHLPKAYAPIVKKLQELAKELEDGKISLSEYQEALSKIAQTNADEGISRVARSMRDAAADALALKRRLDEASASYATLANKSTSGTPEQREKLSNIYGEMADTRSAPSVEKKNAFYTLRDQKLRQDQARASKASRSAKATANEAQRKDDRIKRRIAELKMQGEAIRLNATEQKILNEQFRLGIEPTSEYGKTIEQIIAANDNAEKATRSLAHVQGQFQSAAMSAFGEFTSQIKTGNKALDSLIQNLINATAQAALFGNGPLAGLFGGKGGGGGGGMLGGLLSSFGGFFAKGGTLGAGQWGIAGENGPEPIMGPANILPNSSMKGGGSSSVVIQLADGLIGSIIQENNQNTVKIVQASAGPIADSAVGKAKKGIAQGDFDGSMSRYAARPVTRAR